MKKTGGRFLRGYENLDKRIQDGPKKHLLSSKAEQEFSRRERWFANKIFFPYLNENKQEFIYDENFAYFTISVLWRVLLDQLEHPTISNPKLDFLNDVQEEWKGFLANSIYPINYDNINVMLTDRIISQTPKQRNSDLYMSRVIDATIITNDDCSTVAVYVKFLRFIFWSVVKGNPTNGKNIKLNFSKSKLTLPQSITDGFFGGFIYNRIKEIDAKSKISDSQQQKIVDEIVKNELDFFNSDAAKAMLNDYKLNNKNIG
ncbi:MAG: hypothetical protein ABJG68_11685 [Crocinitomicaceae bacterium]